MPRSTSAGRRHGRGNRSPRLTPRGTALGMAATVPSASDVLEARKANRDRFQLKDRTEAEDQWIKATMEWAQVWQSELFEKERVEAARQRKEELDSAVRALSRERAERVEELKQQAQLAAKPELKKWRDELEQREHELELKAREMDDRLQKRLLELQGEREQERERWLAGQKEGTLEAMYLKAVRRLSLQGVLRGWEAWKEAWGERRRQRRMLQSAGNRLSRPQLTASFAFWKRDAMAHQMSKAELEWSRKVRAAEAMAAEKTAALEAKLAANQRSELERSRRLEAQLREAEQERQRLAGEAAEHELKLRAAEAERQGAEAKVAKERAAREEVAARLAAFQAEKAEQERQRRGETEAERQRRAEVMHQKAMKRLGNQQILRGWLAWEAMWQEHQRRTRMLAAAASRLTRPLVVAAMGVWRESWAAWEETQRAKGHRQITKEAKDAHDEEVRRMREEHLAALRAEREKVAELEKQLLAFDGSAESLERQLSAKMALEKQKRVEEYAQKAMKKLGRQGVSRGWGAWEDAWREKTRMRGLLAGAATKLSRPRLHGGFSHWRRVSAAQKQLEGKQLLSRLEEESRRADSLQRQLEGLQAELARQQGAKAEGGGEQRAKQERVEMLHKQSMRRLQHQGVMRGWGAWKAQWEERARKQRLLLAAAARLLRPKQAMAVAAMRVDALQTKEQALSRAVQMAADDKRRALEAAAEKHAQALERLRVELTGSADEREAARAAREKEERVDLLHRQSMRRLANQDILRGFSAWRDEWEAKTRHTRLLAGATGKLLRPQISASLTHWRQDWQAEERHRLSGRAGEAIAAQKRLYQEALKKLEDDKRRALEAAAEKHAQALERLRVELTGSADEREAARAAREKEERVDLLHRQSMRRLANQDILRGFSAWKEEWEQRGRQRRLLSAAAARLLRPKQAMAVAAMRKEWEAQGALTWQQRYQQQKKEAAAERKLVIDERRQAAIQRRALEDAVLRLEEQLAELGAAAAANIPKRDFRFLLLHSFKAVGVPSSDDSGGSDPYVKVVLLDAEDGEEEEREAAATSFKRNAVNPDWGEERLQLPLAPGGVRPLPMRVEIWDKDFQKSDDQIARAELILPEGEQKGVISMRLRAVKGGGDVERLTFGFELRDKAVPQRLLVPPEAETPRVGRISDRKPASGSSSHRGSRRRQ